MKLMALGRTLEGKLLFPPKEEEAATKELLASMGENVTPMRSLTAVLAKGATFRGEVVRRVSDAGDPRQAGWTYVVAADDPRRNELIQIIEPLARHRGMDNPTAPLVFPGGPEASWGDWLQDKYFALELEGKKVPSYVLLVGGPDRLPFRFHSLMDTAASVGRLHFETLEEFKHYVDKIIRLENAPEPTVTREVIMFATDAGPKDPTYFSRKYMVEPLEEHIRTRLGFPTKALLGEDATKEKLVDTLRAARPALVYTASHGMIALQQPPEVQRRLNGAICCQSFGAPALDDLFTGDDVPTQGPFLEGSVFFEFACYGCGTPAMSDYTHWLKGVPEKYTDTDFVARLPQRLLASPRGPIAFVGHLDTAFMHGFTDPNEPHILERWNARIQPFLHVVQELLRVQPPGLAMEDLSRRYSVCNAMLTNAYDRQRSGSLAWTPELAARFLDTWIIRSDAQNYMILGDPAARLRIPE